MSDRLVFKSNYNKSKTRSFGYKGLLLAFAITILSAFYVSNYIGETKGGIASSRDSVVIPLDYWGLHLHRITTGTPWPPIPFGSWRLWDAYVSWPQLQPQKGKWRFDTLDQYLVLAEEKGVEILLPLGLSPQWASARPDEPSAYQPGFAAEPRDLDDWRNYVQTVATRYKKRIQYYEIWNEPNLKEFYSGSVAHMVELGREAYRILKTVDPAITVISPSATNERTGPGWLEEYLAKGGGEFADVIGYHFYVTPGPPEAMVPLIRKVQETMSRYKVADKPLWNTEAGWLVANSNSTVQPKSGTSFSRVLSKEEAVAYVARSFLLNWTSGVSRFYWYSWDNKTMGLTEEDGKTLKASAIAYKTVQQWLTGARLESCVSNHEGVWICKLTRTQQYPSWIVWNPEKESEFTLPEHWNVTRMRDLLGDMRTLPNIKKVKISPSPLLFDAPLL